MEYHFLEQRRKWRIDFYLNYVYVIIFIIFQIIIYIEFVIFENDVFNPCHWKKRLVDRCIYFSTLFLSRFKQTRRERSVIYYLSEKLVHLLNFIYVTHLLQNSKNKFKINVSNYKQRCCLNFIP